MHPDPPVIWATPNKGTSNLNFGGTARKMATVGFHPSVAGSSASNSASETRPWNARALALAMAAHARLGSHCPQSMREVSNSHDLLLAIFRHLPLVVPDDVGSLAAAVRRAAPWQRVTLRAGEHLVDARDSGAPGSSQLRIHSPVEIVGEPGAILHGTLVLDAACPGGSLRDVRVDDGGDCCVRCEGGSWELSRVRLRCSHGSALLCSGSARVTLRECVLGGEADDEIPQHVMLSAYGSVQEHGLHKRACYAVVAKDRAHVVACHGVLRECSEAAVLVAAQALVRLEACTLAACPAAFFSGQGLGRCMELHRCVLASSVQKVWVDTVCATTLQLAWIARAACAGGAWLASLRRQAHPRPRRSRPSRRTPLARVCLQDRPAAFVWGDGNRREEAGSAEVDAEHGDGHAGIVPREPRGADDSSDTGSLDDPAEFANMEALMEELDLAAMAAASGQQQPASQEG